MWLYFVASPRELVTGGPAGEQPGADEARLDLLDPPPPKSADLTQPALFQECGYPAHGARWLAGSRGRSAQRDEGFVRQERGQAINRAIGPDWVGATAAGVIITGKL
jgi:hypothetical protein